MVLHIKYMYLLLIEIGLKTILAIFWVVYLEVKLQKMLRRKYIPYYPARNLSENLSSALCSNKEMEQIVEFLQ